MMDGLALGETTPVVAFMGFVGRYVKALFGPEACSWQARWRRAW